MSELINAIGLGCTQPVILARNALELHGEITVVTNEQVLLENLKLLCMHEGFSGIDITYLMDIAGETGDTYWIRLSRSKQICKGPALHTNRSAGESKAEEFFWNK